MSILAINSGSSSTKVALFTRTAPPTVLVRRAVSRDGRVSVAERILEEIAPHRTNDDLAGIGHRLVHGGPIGHEPRLIDRTVVDSLRGLIRFAPNHLPDQIALIEDFTRLLPDVPQLVCFDTAFHASLPDHARRLPIPRRYDAAGIRRYGFHGLSYAYLAHALAKIAGPAIAEGRVVLAHLGNGSSLTALHAGRSVDTTMGLTPIGGIVMSTRSGDLDPGVVVAIARHDNLDASRLEDVLSRQSGLLGISGESSDMRELLAQAETVPECRLAVSIYCYEIRKRIGAFAAALGGLDAVVFSGGIGEHAPAVRARVCENLGFLGIELDAERNAAGAQVISTSAGAVPVYVIPTDEEQMIALAAERLLPP